MVSNQDESVFARIYDLCDDKITPEAELILRLESILNINPEVVRHRYPYGCDSVLHFAAEIRSVEFVKLLVEQDSALVRSRERSDGWLPFHAACMCCNVETAKYLYHKYPESINMQTSTGRYPMHIILLEIGRTRMNGTDQDDLEDMIRFLLQHDRGAVSTPDGEGCLPLHYACRSENLVVVKLVYDSHPEAIFSRDRNGRSPVDEARAIGFSHVVSFLETQLEFVRQAREQRNPDANGQLPIHRALQIAHVSLGTIKLIRQANPRGINAGDNQGFTPLHIACQVGDIEASKYIVEARVDTLMARDNSNNLPIHIACRSGKCNVVSYLMTLAGCGASTINGEGKLPIELLLLHGDVDDRSSTEYVKATYSLLRANPVGAIVHLSDTD